MTMVADQRELSTNTRMHLHYTGDAKEIAQYLFLKMVNADMEIASP